MSISRRQEVRASRAVRKAEEVKKEVKVEGLVKKSAQLVGTLYNNSIKVKDTGIKVLDTVIEEVAIQKDLTVEFVKDNRSTWKKTLSATIHKVADKVDKK